MRNAPTCMHSFLTFLAIVASMTMAVSAFGQAERRLDEITGKLTVKQGWGALGINTAAYAPGGPPAMKLCIADKEYAHGLGHHAAGEITVPLNGNYTLFQAEVGVQRQGGGRGSVVFQVWVDGEKRFDSGKMTDSDAAKPVSIPLNSPSRGGISAPGNAQEMKLVATDGGDGFACDMADWAEAPARSLR